jgi:hypothetical protein
MSKNNVKPISQMLQDSTLESKPEIESKEYSPNKLSMKQMYMLQAFQVFLTKILDNHGNVSIMARKSQLAQSEIDNALILTKMVGDCYDSLVNKPD